MLLICIHKMPGLGLDQGINYPDIGLYGLPQSTQASAGINTMK
jgi:hypothetical protein